MHELTPYMHEFTLAAAADEHAAEQGVPRAASGPRLSPRQNGATGLFGEENGRRKGTPRA